MSYSKMPKKMFQQNHWEEKMGKRRSPSHPVVAEYVLQKIKLISERVKLTDETGLLDVGCGNGFFTFYFDKICRTCGLDYSEKMLAMNPVKSLAMGDAANLPFADDSFDVVFCHALLHHVADPGKVIFEMKRVSRKYVIIIEPNRDNPAIFLFSLIMSHERNALKFSLQYLIGIVRKTGLEIKHCFSAGVITPNKTPVFLLKQMKNFKTLPFFDGVTNIIIAEI